MKKAIKKLIHDESAQGATEYILMLVIVVGIAFMFKGKITSLLEGKIEQLGGQINQF